MTWGKRRKRKRTVDYVIETEFWNGFQQGLGDGALCGALQYASTNPLARYDDVREIAERAGYDLAQQVLAAHVERLGQKNETPNGWPRIPSAGFEYKIPASVIAECYGEARIAA